MLEKIFKSENALLKKTNELLRKNIENYKEEIEYLKDTLKKEHLSEEELIKLLISQYNWDLGSSLFDNEYIGKHFIFSLTKRQNIGEKEILKLVLPKK